MSFTQSGYRKTIILLDAEPNAPTTTVASAICPDDLRLSDLGVADTWRGHIVRLLIGLLR